MFKFRVNPDGGEPFDAEATSRDIVMWERLGRGRSLGKLSQSPTMVDMYSLAHVACQRLGMFAGTLPEFETQVDLEFEAVDEATDPTQPAP